MMSNVLTSVHTGTESRLKQELFSLDLCEKIMTDFCIMLRVLNGIMEKMNNLI